MLPSPIVTVDVSEGQAIAAGGVDGKGEVPASLTLTAADTDPLGESVPIEPWSADTVSTAQIVPNADAAGTTAGSSPTFHYLPEHSDAPLTPILNAASSEAVEEEVSRYGSPPHIMPSTMDALLHADTAPVAATTAAATQYTPSTDKEVPLSPPSSQACTPGQEPSDQVPASFTDDRRPATLLPLSPLIAPVWGQDTVMGMVATVNEEGVQDGSAAGAEAVLGEELVMKQPLMSPVSDAGAAITPLLIPFQCKTPSSTAHVESDLTDMESDPGTSTRLTAGRTPPNPADVPSFLTPFQAVKALGDPKLHELPTSPVPLTAATPSPVKERSLPYAITPADEPLPRDASPVGLPAVRRSGSFSPGALAARRRSASPVVGSSPLSGQHHELLAPAGAASSAAAFTATDRDDWRLDEPEPIVRVLQAKTRPAVVDPTIMEMSLPPLLTPGRLQDGAAMEVSIEHVLTQPATSYPGGQPADDMPTYSDSPVSLSATDREATDEGRILSPGSIAPSNLKTLPSDLVAQSDHSPVASARYSERTEYVVSADSSGMLEDAASGGGAAAGAATMPEEEVAEQLAAGTAIAPVATGNEAEYALSDVATENVERPALGKAEQPVAEHLPGVGDAEIFGDVAGCGESSADAAQTAASMQGLSAQGAPEGPAAQESVVTPSGGIVDGGPPAENTAAGGVSALTAPGIATASALSVPATVAEPEVAPVTALAKEREAAPFAEFGMVSPLQLRAANPEETLEVVAPPLLVETAGETALTSAVESDAADRGNPLTKEGGEQAAIKFGTSPLRAAQPVTEGLTLYPIGYTDEALAAEATPPARAAYTPTSYGVGTPEVCVGARGIPCQGYTHLYRRIAV